MRTKPGRWIFTVLLPAAAAALLTFVFFARAHRQLQASSQQVLDCYEKTRNYAMREKTTASFYCINSLPASVHANYLQGRQWVDLGRTEKLWGTRFKQRIHLNFDREGSITSYYSEGPGTKQVNRSSSIPPAVLYNRIGEEVVFCFNRDGAVIMQPKGRL